MLKERGVKKEENRQTILKWARRCNKTSRGFHGAPWHSPVLERWSSPLLQSAGAPALSKHVWCDIGHEDKTLCIGECLKKPSLAVTAEQLEVELEIDRRSPLEIQTTTILLKSFAN